MHHTIGDSAIMTDAGRPLSDNAKQVIFAQSTDDAWITLVTITHPSLATPIRVADDSYELLPLAGRRGVESRGNEFIYVPFMVELPTQDDTNISLARITMDNISREQVLAVRGADSALGITIEIVLASDVDTVEAAVSNFKLERVNYDALTISGEISVEYFDLEPLPKRRFTPSDFPGLF